ncbi:MAG: 3-hydroxyacyl-ACP dehydratase FabZ family protein [Bacillota bacterium]|nr:3-hydroxyacyl-ACP dehydratase FabZ family protein [Bacillota bacterium]
MNQEEIKKIIPHRDNMLLVEEVNLLDETTSEGKYTINGDEWFLKGHFPGNPVVPGVVLCEMMGQASCILVASAAEDATPYFSTLNNVKFKGKVLPGDTFRSVCKLVRQKSVFYFVEAKGYVGDKLCVSAELSFAIVKN